MRTSFLFDTNMYCSLLFSTQWNSLKKTESLLLFLVQRLLLTRSILRSCHFCQWNNLQKRNQDSVISIFNNKLSSIQYRVSTKHISSSWNSTCLRLKHQVISNLKYGTYGMRFSVWEMFNYICEIRYNYTGLKFM